MFGKQNQSAIKIFTDGAICQDKHICGLAAVLYNSDGRLLDVVYHACRLGTNNETEYRAVLLALNEAIKRKIKSIVIFTDSQILVHQITGMSSINAPGLKSLHYQLMLLLGAFDKVDFCHISREENQVADAFANQALLDWKGGKYGKRSIFTLS